MRRRLAAVLTWLVQRAHAVLGHDLMIEHDGPTIRVVCIACGWQSRGIEIETRKAA